MQLNTTQETMEMNKIAYLNLLQTVKIRPNSNQYVILCQISHG